MNFTALFNNLSSALPATVAAAIIIFIVKEIFELVRRSKERRRKLNAIKLLLSEEIEKNHWSHTSLFRLLAQLKEVFEGHPNAEYRLHIARNGSEHFRLKEDPDDSFESGQWIPHFHDEQYKKLLPTLAELDQSIFKTVNETYAALAELSHYRDTLTAFLAGEDNSPDEDLTKAFLGDLAGNRDDYYRHLNCSYGALTGKKLEGWRLR